MASARVRELIEIPERTREIREAIAQGKDPYGMVTFDQSLADLVRRKLVTYEEALRHSSAPDDFALLFRGVSGGGNQEDWVQEQVRNQSIQGENVTQHDLSACLSHLVVPERLVHRLGPAVN